MTRFLILFHLILFGGRFLLTVFAFYRHVIMSYTVMFIPFLIFFPFLILIHNAAVSIFMGQSLYFLGINISLG